MHYFFKIFSFTLGDSSDKHKKTVLMTCTLIHIVSTGYNAAVLRHCWFLFILWWGYWYANTSPSDKKSVYSKSMILRWPLRPIGLLFTLFWQFNVHIEQGLNHMVWKSYTSKQKVDNVASIKKIYKKGWKGKLCVWQILFAKEQRGRTQIDVIYWIGRILKYIKKKQPVQLPDQGHCLFLLKQRDKNQRNSI